MKAFAAGSLLLMMTFCMACHMGKGIDIKISNQSGGEVSKITFTTSE